MLPGAETRTKVYYTTLPLGAPLRSTSGFSFVYLDIAATSAVDSRIALYAPSAASSPILPKPHVQVLPPLLGAWRYRLLSRWNLLGCW